jgi:hypothetical protein
VDSSIAETNATLQFNHEATATNPLCNDDILCSWKLFRRYALCHPHCTIAM